MNQFTVLRAIEKHINKAKEVENIHLYLEYDTSVMCGGKSSPFSVEYIEKSGDKEGVTLHILYFVIPIYRSGITNIKNLTDEQIIEELLKHLPDLDSLIHKVKDGTIIIPENNSPANQRARAYIAKNPEQFNSE